MKVFTETSMAGCETVNIKRIIIHERHASWEILDTCSEEKTVVDSGAFVKHQKEYQSSNEVCAAENGRYKFIIHVGGNGIENDGQFDFD